MNNRILQPRRVFLANSGTVSLSFCIPGLVAGCGADDGDSDGATPNPDWEMKAAALESQGAGIYTAANPLDQPGKEGSHAPMVSLVGANVTLASTHEMRAPTAEVPEEHYITHHYIRDSNGVIIGWKEYTLGIDTQAQTTFALPAGTTQFTAFQSCNLHWTWST